MLIEPEVINDLSSERRQAIMKRSTGKTPTVFEDMFKICIDISKRGDEVALEHYKKFKEDMTEKDFVVTRDEIDRAYDSTSSKLVEKLHFAKENIEKFHAAQREREMWSVEISPGILAGRIVRPLDIVGCYFTGRRASYPSTVLMTCIPAKVAGVKQVIGCTPPNEGMVANNVTLVAADIVGCDAIYKIGGPWAIGSMAYGTETVPKVDKIVGPGNRYVTAAKRAVFGVVDLDSPAGPSEVLIIADDEADPRWVAIDYISQIEHAPDNVSVLITPSTELANAVCSLLEKMIVDIPRREIVTEAIDNSSVLVADSMAQAIEFSNEFAPEHLEIVTADPMAMLPRVKHAGSIFLGPYAPVPVGDYASGTNHVLPTGQCARMFSGLSLDDFIKKPTFQYITREGLEYLSEAVITIAEAEGLLNHAQAIRERFEYPCKM
jgi:histidinol dehydrogenase